MRNKELLTKAFLKEANIDGDEKEWYCKLWRNLRKNHPSMRLTKDGYNFLTKQVQLKEYRLKMPSDMNMNAQVTLDSSQIKINKAIKNSTPSSLEKSILKKIK